MKRVRMLLRVSSNQQLEADGDLSVQRQLVKDYISGQIDWKLDEKEYFEGSNSGYKNAVADRDVLQEALQDAKAKEYDILVVYKDDRIGRRMWEIGAYVMSLKSFGVDIYTVKDGCISPESDDIMGQMMLALRYGNAQKSSSDTGMRVKDTAQKLVQKGKFMGGKAPYGYKLELSGEVSKHGRALHHLVVVPEQAEVVKYIYELSLHKEYGATKITKILSEHEVYKNRAPRDIWKSGTITSILTNPIYAGYTAYKRRERIDGKYHKLDSKDWVFAEKPDLSMTSMADNKKTLYRHNPNVTITKDNSGSEADTLVAFSDTTSSTVAVDAAEDVADTANNDLHMVTDPFRLIAYLVGIGGVGAALVAIFVILLCLAVALSPFILVVMIIYLRLKSRSKRMAMIEKAMEKGQPLPEELLEKNSNKDGLMVKGIRNLSIGIGIVVFGLIMDIEFFVGIGGILACYGAGQAIIPWLKRKME